MHLQCPNPLRAALRMSEGGGGGGRDIDAMMGDLPGNPEAIVALGSGLTGISLLGRVDDL